MRKASQSHFDHAPMPFCDVNTAAAITLLKNNDTDCIIHGHTHQPMMHTITVDKSNAQRYVLGAWEQKTAKILRLDEDQSLHFESLCLFELND